MSKHIEGPWDYDTGDLTIYSLATNETIAVIPGGNDDDPVAEANACLIAAAPDLLEALTVLVEAKNIKESVGPTHRYTELRDRGWNLARAAIAKAEGRS